MFCFFAAKTTDRNFVEAKLSQNSQKQGGHCYAMA
jgi:hypothetical protein